MNNIIVSSPVITFDGPTASGKGIIARRIASILGYHLLDSGILYRLIALSAIHQNIPNYAVSKIVSIIPKLGVNYLNTSININNIENILRHEVIGNFASVIARYQPIRNALLETQHTFRCVPGLVADGRDMGSKIFPDALVKIFITANIKTRIMRRYKQLRKKGFFVNINNISRTLEERDIRDMSRHMSPLVIPNGAHILDTSEMTVEYAVKKVLTYCHKVGLG